MISASYKYLCRKGFGSDEMLIEIRQGAEKKDFLKDFLQAIRRLNPVFDEIIDLWQNDEVVYEFSSNIGAFTVTKDVWGFAFVLSENNQAAINAINKSLQFDENFSQVDATTI